MSNNNNGHNVTNSDDDLNHTTTTTTTTTTKMDPSKFHFAIDRGGTFTDIYATVPILSTVMGDGGISSNANSTTESSSLSSSSTTANITTKEVVMKLLSVDPSHYDDAPTEGIRRILQQYDTTTTSSSSSSNLYERHTKVCTRNIGSIRMGTTVATNALLERNGARIALLITNGFTDLLHIGNQSRPNIFDLQCKQTSVLYESVVPINERIVLKQYTPKSYSTLYEEHVGITGEVIQVIEKPNVTIIQEQLEQLYNKGITSIAICCMHSYIYPQHEILIGQIAQNMNCFDQISLSHEIMPAIKLVSRTHTTTASAYLTPNITTYIQNFINGFDENLLSNVSLSFMKSDGGLTLSTTATTTTSSSSSSSSSNTDNNGSKPKNKMNFGGHEAILSGPAGGVVGYAKTSYRNNQPVIGFDMGGTSTDVSRYGGKWEHVFETITAGIAIQAPQLDIHTVAAGGGSRLYLRRGMFVVGPESARAHPGPICYRKNGYLAVTDANVVLGRIVPHHFPKIFGPNEDEALDVDGARIAFQELTTLPEAKGRTLEELAYGFLQVANEAMCRPIRNLTQMKGYDLTTHTLACFGGAGPQHACAMAKALGMKKVFIHRYGGILSAYGLCLADAVYEEQVPAHEIYNGQLSSTGEEKLTSLTVAVKKALIEQGYHEDSIVIERFINMRYHGTDNAIMIQESVDESYDVTFQKFYQREFGFELKGRYIEIDDYRVRGVVPGPTPISKPTPSSLGAPPTSEYTKTYFESGWVDVPVYKAEELLPGHEIPGPCIIVQPISIVVVEIDCVATVTGDSDLEIHVGSNHVSNSESDVIHDIVEDPVQLSIFAHRFMGIAEQMGRTLQRTSISVNMKERLDFSCALFTKDGGLVANAPHIPVHLGAMERAVRFQIEYWNSEDREGIQEGDVLVSNHPQLAGGSHLPDITVITPVFHENEIIFFVASRGHHADIGGIAPGSMPPHSHRLQDEGAMIIAFKLVKTNEFQEEGITEILMSPGKLPGNSGTRNLSDNLSDLRAQVAANNSGIRLLQELVKERGLRHVEAYMRFIQKNAEVAVRRMLIDFAAKHGACTHAIDYMDDGSPIELTIKIDMETGSATFDFTGTGPQVFGNHNAPPAVTYSAVIYSLRSLVADDIPLNQGCLAPITFIIPKHTLLNPSSEAAVVGGNVLTSQRVVDVVLRAFQACAASQGCMNNLTFGDDEFGYYETIAGGAGAGPTWTGTSGVHTHCTNTRITDPEILERRYPVLLRQFSLRPGSGGRGKHNGGDGIIREIEPLRPLTMSILSERRTLHPYGMAGGEDGACGRNLLIRQDGVTVNLGGRCSTTIYTGERLRIETPGGGGYGPHDITNADIL